VKNPAPARAGAGFFSLPGVTCERRINSVSEHKNDRHRRVAGHFVLREENSVCGSRHPVGGGRFGCALTHRREAVSALAHEHREPRTTVLCQGKSNFGKLYAVHAVRHSEAVLTVMVAICSHGVHFLEKVQVQVRSLEHNRTVTEIVVFEPRTPRRVRSVGVSESLGRGDERLSSVLRVGLTGGIGAGKSTVSKILSELGAVIVDADLIAREVVEPGTPGLAALVDAFGDGILSEDGSLNRPALASLAFADDTSRGTLNGILHPLIGARTMEQISSAPSDAVLVQDIPLLVEGSMAPAFNLVVIVYVDEEERVRRLVGSRGMPESDARARIAAQANDDQRRAVADVWLDNSGEPGSLDDVVRDLWANRLVPFEKNLREGTVVRALPELTPADPSWPAQAERIIGRLSLASGDRARRIDHIGSTAVPGLDAKDVIDIQITVEHLGVADDLAEDLAAAGFPRIEHIVADDPKPSYLGGETDPAVWAKRIHGSADPGRRANIHIRVDGWPGQQFAILFRDWLRADASARAEYAELKVKAAESAAGIDDYAAAIDAYLGVKTPWFDAAFHRAWEWAEKSGWSL